MEERNKFLMALSILFVLVLVGTLFYHFVEGWSFIDGFYFSSTTLTTVGFGDLHPTKDISKLFTSFYVISGVSLALYALAEVAKMQLALGERQIMKKFLKRDEGEIVWAKMKKK